MVCVSESGLYLPISDFVDLFKKLPELSTVGKLLPQAAPNSPVPVSFFSNPLLIPPGYWEARFDAKNAAAPKLRLTNAGFLIVTVEIDPQSPEEFEEQFAWTRGAGEDFSRSALAEIDRNLCKFKEYRGHCVVFSGRQSLHFHFVFSTKHLVNCPWDVTAEDRLDGLGAKNVVLMDRARETYWDLVTEKFSETIGRNLAFDRELRRATQWRRTPWAIRTLEKDADFLGLQMGASVPQIVLHENIRRRASENAVGFGVPGTFSVSNPVVKADRYRRVRQPRLCDKECCTLRTLLRLRFPLSSSG